MTRALLQQALDALEDSLLSDGYRNYELQAKAIATLCSALEAPEPEPYGHVTTHTVTGQQFFYRYPSPPYLDTAKECIAVYAAPPAAPAPAAPVVPLTDEQLAKIAVEDEFLLYCDQDSFNEIARAIELAHGIGTTGGGK